MKCSYDSYVNKKSFLLLLLFFSWVFFKQWAPLHFLSCREQCYSFEFPNLAVALKHSFCFINTMPIFIPLFLHRVFFLKHLYPPILTKHPAMTLTKGKGSSHRKGKEIASNNPATKAIGEDAPLSESKHSEEKEGSCDPNNKCAPLVDPWYDTHSHFPTVPSDYLPPPSGCMWLSICGRNIEVS